MTGSILGFSLPNFWLGLMLILLFAVELQMAAGGRARRDAPSCSASNGRSSRSTGLRHLILPALTLAIYKARW